MDSKTQSTVQVNMPPRFGPRALIITIIALVCIITIAVALMNQMDDVVPYPQVYFIHFFFKLVRMNKQKKNTYCKSTIKNHFLPFFALRNKTKQHGQTLAILVAKSEMKTKQHPQVVD